MRLLPGLCVLICLLFCGLFICKDYGVTWDEPLQRRIGEVNLQFIRSGDDSLMAHFDDRDHGAAFEVPLKWIEEVIGPKDVAQVYFIRHLCTFIFFLAGVWCAYLLALRLFRKQWIALLGMVLLVLQPRIFAHAFFNSKDVPFLSAVLITLYAIAVALDKRRGYPYLLAGMACGYATGIRTMGLLPAAMIFALLISNIFSKEKRKSASVGLALFCLGTAGMLYISWPWLWHHPGDNLLASYDSLSHFTRWGGSLLFDGITYKGDALPPGYIPQWFAISTPLCWLLLGIYGLFATLYFLFKKPKTFLQTTKGKMLMLCAALFLLPVILVICLHSVLYDDWRHLYFIYAPFVVLALFGAEYLSTFKRGKVAVAGAVILQFIVTSIFMVRAHPFQQVYFNALAPHRPEYLRTHFDYEYWGASFKQGLEYILTHDSRDTIVIEDNMPIMNNFNCLSPDQQKRIRWVDTSLPGAYFLTTYRSHPQDYPYPKVYGIKVGNSTLMQIYRIDTNLSK